MRSLSLATILLHSITASALDAGSDCLTQLEKSHLDFNAQRQSSYEILSNDKSGIKPGNEPQLLLGNRTDHAVIVVHGFMASPYEVKELAERIHAEGFTVYMPLIFGFGGSEHLANHTKLNVWRRTLPHAVGLLSACYSKVALVGFSLGGALVSDYVLTNPDFGQDPPKQPITVTSVTLLSPYYDAAVKHGQCLNEVMKTFTDEVDIKCLHDLSKNPDLVAPLNHPEYYNHAMPLGAVKTIFEFSEILKAIPSTVKSEVPAMLSISNADQTIDIKLAKTFVIKHFNHFEKSHVFLSSKKIPHQIALSEFNPEAKGFYEAVVEFISAHADSNSK